MNYLFVAVYFFLWYTTKQKECYKEKIGERNEMYETI